MKKTQKQRIKELLKKEAIIPIAGPITNEGKSNYVAINKKILDKIYKFFEVEQKVKMPY